MNGWPKTGFERDEQELEEAFARGEIDDVKFQYELRQLHRAMRDEARESADREFNREMDRWGYE